MNLIKILGDVVLEEIIKNLSKFPLSENKRDPNFQVKEILVGINSETKNKGDVIQTITEKSKEFFQRSEQNVFLGKDHSITLPILKSFVQFHQNTGIVIFDAHPDCLGLGDLVPALINQNIIRRENVVLVGLRNWTREELSFLQQNKIKYFTMQEIGVEGKFEVSESVMSIARRFDSLYISIDADVLDPAFVLVNTPEPGGLSVRELLFFLHRLKRLKNFRGGDLSELKLESALVGAKIVSELLG